jgi:hypothetical protein
VQQPLEQVSCNAGRLATFVRRRLQPAGRRLQKSSAEVAVLSKRLEMLETRVTFGFDESVKQALAEHGGERFEELVILSLSKQEGDASSSHCTPAGSTYISMELERQDRQCKYKDDIEAAFNALVMQESKIKAIRHRVAEKVADKGSVELQEKMQSLLKECTTAYFDKVRNEMELMQDELNQIETEMFGSESIDGLETEHELANSKAIKLEDFAERALIQVIASVLFGGAGFGVGAGSGALLGASGLVAISSGAAALGGGLIVACAVVVSVAVVIKYQGGNAVWIDCAARFTNESKQDLEATVQTMRDKVKEVLADPARGKRAIDKELKHAVQLGCTTLRARVREVKANLHAKAKDKTLAAEEADMLRDELRKLISYRRAAMRNHQQYMNEKLCDVPPPDFPTFEKSNFKKAYDDQTVAITLATEVFGKVSQFLKVYCRELVDGFDSATQQHVVDNFIQSLQKETAAHDQVEVLAKAGPTAELLWTSALKFKGMPTAHQKELSSLINSALRSDKPGLAAATADVVRAINTLCVTRFQGPDIFPVEWLETVEGLVKWKSDGITYRGGSFDSACKDFFKVGKQYRVPGFLATSFSEKTAVHFRDTIAQAAPGDSRILWIIHGEPNAAQDADKRCKHANFVKNSHIADPDGTPRESEFLYAPYSVFTVLQTQWGSGGSPHTVHLSAEIDNAAEWVPAFLPLAPWY